MNKTVSIIICTYNRAPFLNRTLYSLRNLHYKDFEVIVVNGPSDDYTEEILERYKGRIKTAKNPEKNLSVSRNIGIRLAAGDIVAFIDDDAIPDPMWLDDIVSMYDDPSVGGAGGVVYGPGDAHTQFENGYVDFWGDAEVHCPQSDYNDKDGDRYNMMLGTNCTFLRSVMQKVGGFDEYYDYFHDESDACLRVVRAGFAIRNHPRAYIHHEFAKSHIRKDTRDSLRFNWYPILKNQAYFAIKNSEGKATPEELQQKLDSILTGRLHFLKNGWREGAISRKEWKELSEKAKRGFLQGCADGAAQPRKLRFDLNGGQPFLRADFSDAHDLPRSICFLCRDDLHKAVGGVAKYSNELAKGFAAERHIVHVITEGESEADWIEGDIGFHSIPLPKDTFVPELSEYPSSHQNLLYSLAVYKKVLKISEKYGLDIVESPLWNYEGCVAAHGLRGKLPVVVRLQTPLLKVCETQHWPVTADMEIAADFERSMMQDAAGIISISDHIRETIQTMYGIDFEKSPHEKVFLGIDKNKYTEQSGRRKQKKALRVLFIGRLERRKGIQTIFAALPKLMQRYKHLEIRLIGNTQGMDTVLGCTFKDYFKKTYKQYSWAKRVHFLGEVDNDTKDRELAACDVFIAPSLYESFGIILIEAMAAKKPVIGCRIGGMQEITQDGKTGYLIEPEDADAFYEKLCALLDSESLRDRFGEAAYARYCETFSNAAMVQNTLRFYSRFWEK